eukprot:CAMPEP_0197031198 /NCGR_PEP_ID=MMETSP1384-20130603/10274_1 /TAXON_ID=29189 /ORGANISM="Ammonia sp." /LENGTH=864 /DNA_ID=CAMNT_0042460693 /DNA_START=14 /DNA_END=2608 /DNA_ORIENTATION=-
MASIPVIKTCLLGGGCQGKSALVLQFITNTFLSDYDPTIEDTYRKNVTVNDQSALLEILDTAGQKDFWSMQEQWIRDSQIFILVYSICSREGFKIVDQLRNTVFSVKGTDKVPIVLVGTQSDLASERVVGRDEAQQKATAWDCEYIEVSAKTREHLEELFNMAVPLYTTHFAQKAIEQEMGNQAQGRSSRGCVCCADDHEDFDEIEADGAAFKARQKKEPKIQFFKTEELPPDVIPNPILSLKNFRIARQFHWVRFIGAALSGIFVPLVVIFQTIAFFSYSERTDPGCFYPADYPYHDPHAGLLWDYLGMIVGRRPGQDPEAIKDRKWFLRQTGTQKCKRLIFTVIVCVVFVVCCFNVSQIGNFQVSYMESVGPFLLFWIVWLLLSVWIGYEQTLKPPIPAPTRLRSLTIFFGEDFSHRSSVYKFVRAWESSRTNNRWKLTKLRTFIIICLGVLYAITPGLTRITFGDSTEEANQANDGRKSRTFFSQDGNYYVEVGALITNFILVTSILYCVEIQYKKQFDNYTVWMNDLTMLLNKTDAEHDVLKAKENEDVVDIPSKGTAFSKDLFISLLRRQNALGWFEIRSFIAVQGQILFAEQELPTLWMISITCLLCLFIFYRAYFIPGNPLESILFNGTAILTIICVVALIRILITSYVCEGIQFLQEKLVAEQKFFMRCNRPYDNVIVDSNAVGMLEEARSKSRSKLTDNPLHTDADERALEEEAPINTQKTDLTEIEMAGKSPSTGPVSIDAEMATTLVVPLKHSEDDIHEHRDDEKEPLLQSNQSTDLHPKNPLNVIRDKVIKIEDVNRYSYNVNFIDDTLVLLKKKDIYPRLFKLKVNSVLSKVVAGCVIAVIVTAFKIFLFY